MKKWWWFAMPDQYIELEGAINKQLEVTQPFLTDGQMEWFKKG